MKQPFEKNGSHPVRVKAGKRLPVPYLPGGGFQYGLADRNQSVERLQGYHTWVYRAVQLKADALAKQNLRLYKRSGKERVELEDHVLLDLLRRPNPIMTRFELWKLTWTYLELDGNSYWYKAMNRMGVPAELWPIRPDLIEPVPDPVNIVKGYLFEFGGKTIAFAPEEILHLQYPNPLSPFIGLGTLDAARYLYDTDLFMRKHDIATFKNYGRPDAVLETEQRLLEDDVKRLELQWRQAYGGTSNAHKTAVLEQGLKYKPLSMTPQQLDFIESKKLSKIDIFEIFGIPRSIAGIVEDVNRANAEAEKYMFAEYTLAPLLTMLEEKLTHNFAQQIDPALEFDFESPVPEDKEFELKRRESNLKNYVTSINEERAKDGEEAAAWGESPFIPFNLLPWNSGFGEEGSQLGAQVASPASAKDAEATPQEGYRQIEIVRQPITRAILFNEDFRVASWKAFNNISRAHENGFVKGLKPLFKAQRKQVMANLRQVKRAWRSRGKSVKADAGLLDFILFNLEDWTGKFAQDMDPYFIEAVKAGALRGIEAIGADSSFADNSPIVQAFLEDKEFKFAFEVNNTTLDALRDTLIDGLDADETFDDLAARVNEIFEFAEGFRAQRIARTEVNTSTNFGIHDAYRQSGIVEKKNWLSQRDGSVRESHQLDNEIVELKGAFSNGLLYPGDPDGDVSEIVECRCSTLPVVGD